MLAAEEDPGIALAYGAAYVSRGDLAVAGAYVVLWTQNHSSEQGIAYRNETAKDVGRALAQR